MKTLILLSMLIAVDVSAAGGVQIKKYRWVPQAWKPLPYLFSASIDKLGKGQQPEVPLSLGLGEIQKGQKILPSKGELVQKGSQMVGSAKIVDSWTQTIFHLDGKIVYATGKIFENIPSDLRARVSLMEKNLAAAESAALQFDPDMAQASTRLPTQIEIRWENGALVPYWRVQYITAYEDSVRYVEVYENGRLRSQGTAHVDEADGKGLVYPNGPILSALSEEPLFGLLGDGTLSGDLIRVRSALDIDVRSPNLLFFFQEQDKRFDLTQVYYLLQKGFGWMREHLGVDLRRVTDVKTHIGNGGVSNAAFYVKDTNTVYLGTGDGVAYRDILRDPSVVIHEGMHAVIAAYAGLPPDGEGGAFNEGFADLFTALILDNPNMGEVSWVKGPYRRTMNHDEKAKDLRGAIYHDGSIIAATFWDMRARLGVEKTAQLAFKTLVRLGKGASYADFLGALVESSAFMSPEEQAFVLETAKNRGWVMVP